MNAGMSAAPIERIQTSVFVVPTERPESDGTLSWDHTTMVLVRLSAGGQEGIGYTYASGAAARVVEGTLANAISGSDAMAIPAIWNKMRRSIRNLGQPGVAFNAVSAVDAALWDLKARLLGVPLVTLFGDARREVPAYASGGFTSYDERELVEQLSSFAEDGFGFVKMKVGRDPAEDVARVLAARRAIGADTALFVDANGAYSKKLALAQALAFADAGVTWFEEPVSSDDLSGLHFVRDRVPAGMDVAAGEYGYAPMYFHRMLEAGAVDVLQADATRCGGFSGFLIAAALVEARSMELSAHCAPALHIHVCASLRQVRHVEYFHDHVRIERLLFDGVPEVRFGALSPDRGRPGLGLTLKTRDAARFAAHAA